MSGEIAFLEEPQTGMLAAVRNRMMRCETAVNERLCMLDARMRMLAQEPEEGAATAEYAVVLVAATGFAALLVGILKSDTVKTMLTGIIKKALSVG